ncbi:MAG: histidine kinase, partial [Bacteroidia bacterium]|nr:histidine kinase [Bacteroidia bacterium]
MNIEKLKLLVNTVQKLSLARDIETITDIVRKSARNLTGADGATFVLKDNNMC